MRIPEEIAWKLSVLAARIETMESQAKLAQMSANVLRAEVAQLVAPLSLPQGCTIALAGSREPLGTVVDSQGRPIPDAPPKLAAVPDSA